MRIIDADILKNNIDNESWERFCKSDEDLFENHSEMLFSCREIQAFVDNAPTIEPKQGEWIYHEDWKNDGECPYECSECGTAYDYDMNFCGYCGAKMQSEVSNIDTDNAKYTCENCKHDRWHTKPICGKCVRQDDGKPSEWEGRE